MSKLEIDAENTALIVLDTETTGLDHKSEKLIEVAAVKLEGDTVVDTFTSMVRPNVPIRHSSFQIHGITDEMVADAPEIEEVLPKLLEFMGDLPFAAHNAVFDYSFINEAHKVIYSKRWKVRKIDTLEMYRSVFPDEPSHSLSSMLDRFGFDSHVSHRALDDAQNLARCYPQLRKLYEQRYQWQLNQLNQIEYLVERYLRMQKSIQIMQSEMSDLKEVFKLHFNEGGQPIQATTGELMVSSTRRTYEYDDSAVWPVLLDSALVKKGARLNPRYLDRLIDNGGTDDDVRSNLKEARLSMNESRVVNFIKPQPQQAASQDAELEEEEAPVEEAPVK